MTDKLSKCKTASCSMCRYS